jgi:hypothetical protein
MQENLRPKYQVTLSHFTCATKSHYRWIPQVQTPGRDVRTSRCWLIVFCDVVPCNLIDVFWRFEGICCLHHRSRGINLSRWLKHQAFLKHGIYIYQIIRRHITQHGYVYKIWRLTTKANGMNGTTRTCSSAAYYRGLCSVHGINSAVVQQVLLFLLPMR